MYEVSVTWWVFKMIFVYCPTGPPFFKLLHESQFFAFWLYLTAYEILVLWPEIKLEFPTVEAWSLNHWTTKEFPRPVFWEQELHICCVLFCLLQTEGIDIIKIK